MCLLNWKLLLSLNYFKFIGLKILEILVGTLGPNIITVNTVFWAALHSSSQPYSRCELQMLYIDGCAVAHGGTRLGAKFRGCLIQMSDSTLSCLQSQVIYKV